MGLRERLAATQEKRRKGEDERIKKQTEKLALKADQTEKRAGLLEAKKKEKERGDKAKIRVVSAKGGERKLITKAGLKTAGRIAVRTGKSTGQVGLEVGKGGVKAAKSGLSHFEFQGQPIVKKKRKKTKPTGKIIKKKVKGGATLKRGR